MFQKPAILIKRMPILPLFVTLAYAFIVWFALSGYLLWQSINFLLGLTALLVITEIDVTKKIHLRYGWLAMALAAVAYILPLKTVLYFSLVFAIFFLIESYWGKLTMLPLLVVALMSPFFQYVSDIFSFDIRLKLTDWAGLILKLFDNKFQVEGNIITRGEQVFAVDYVCIGLNMMATSLLIAILIIGVYQKRIGKRLPFFGVIIYLTIVFVLAILSNLIRIICLVQFNIPPRSIFHEIAGLACLSLYVIIPTIFIGTQLIRKWGSEAIPNPIPGIIINKYKLYFSHLIVLSMITISAFRVSHRDFQTRVRSAPVASVPGYNSERIDADVVKLENTSALIYLKFIPDFINPDHNPMICWKGSGYNLQEVKKDQMYGVEIYSAVLKNKKDTLFTSWWYENGAQRTISQMKWRWDVMKGFFCLAVPKHFYVCCVLHAMLHCF